MRNVGEHTDLFTVSFPSDQYEIDNGDGTYTNMADTSNSDLSPIQAKSTDQLPGRAARTERCAAGKLFDRHTSERASQCWARAEEDGLLGEDAGRRLQGAVDPNANAAPERWDPLVQCGGAEDPGGRAFPDLRDDCDTLAFQVHSNNGLNRMYCMHVEITNSRGFMVFPQQTKRPGSVYSEAHRTFIGGEVCGSDTSSGECPDTTSDEQRDQGRVCFNTTEIEYVLVGDAEDAFAAGGEPLRVDGRHFDCSTFCPATTDLLCMAGQPACSQNFFAFLGVVVAVILFCVVAKRLRLGPFSKKKKVKIVTKTKVVHAKPAKTEGTENPVAVGSTKHFCPNCGTPFSKETHFCANCGTANDQEEAGLGKD